MAHLTRRPRYLKPSPDRIAMALGAATLAASMPVLPVALVLFPIVLVIAGMHAVMLGLPAYLQLRRWVPISWGVAIISGAVIAALPVGLFAVGWELWRPEMVGTDYQDPLWPLVLTGAFCGVIAGAVFRLVLGEPERDFADGFDATIFE